MAAADPAAGRAAKRYPVVAKTATPVETAGSASNAAAIAAESLGTIRADIATQLEWLDAIEAALANLRRWPVEDPALVDAAAIAERLRTAIASAAPAQSSRALWLCLYGTVSALFLKHFSAAIGDDLGHAAAHKIIEVLSSLEQYLNL